MEIVLIALVIGATVVAAVCAFPIIMMRKRHLPLLIIGCASVLFVWNIGSSYGVTGIVALFTAYALLLGLFYHKAAK